MICQAPVELIVTPFGKNSQTFENGLMIFQTEILESALASETMWGTAENRHG